MRAILFHHGWDLGLQKDASENKNDGGTIRALGLAGAVAAASVAGATAAQAGAFGLREQSAQGLGLVFAGAASGGAGVSSIFWNPATVTMRPGFASEQSLSFINLSGEITPTVGTAPGLLPFGSSGEVGQGAVVPSGATSYQLTDRLWVGIQTGAPTASSPSRARIGRARSMPAPRGSSRWPSTRWSASRSTTGSPSPRVRTSNISA
ncbi:hypothetical protein GCM10025880_15810 [Methylorubrum aminovorans]|nr:hypothetical protein GCM10025880_15810 [Methylorubrum aminovorans]